MNKLIPVMFAGAFLAGCAPCEKCAPCEDCEGPEPVFPSDQDIRVCPNAPGRPLQIFYGDSKINVQHILEVKQREAVTIQLHPDPNSVEGVNYRDLEIWIAGKDENSQWLNRKFKASDTVNRRFTICVEDRRPGSYQYLINVPGVGQIDPRIIVIPG